jgi:hypothetical protein
MKSQRNSNWETTSGWAGLYKLGSVSALLLVVIIIITGIVFSVEPQPLDGTALDWFMLFQRNSFLGLVEFELLMVIYVIVSIPVGLSLYILLKRVSPAWMIVYLILSLLGVMCFIVARPAFEMLSLSNGYATATTDGERAMFLAAGQMLVATFHGTAFQISYILGSLTGLILSLVMLQTHIFGKAFAYVRIASSICDFGLYIPVIGIYISMFSVLFLFVWNIMIARRLFQLGNNTTGENTNQADKGLLTVPTVRVEKQI